MYFIHLFLQAFCSETQEVPDSLMDTFTLLPDLLTEAKASSTTNTYYLSFLRWRKWALCNGINEPDILPAKPLFVALYLTSLVQSSKTPSPVIQAFYGLKWAHSMIGAKESPTDSVLVTNVLEGAKRRLSVRRTKKEPITPELLGKVYDSLDLDRNLYNQRLVSALLTAFAGFLRVSELLNIRRKDITFRNCYMSILIPNSKTDIYRDGHSVIIARTGTRLCPVKNLELYLLLACIPDGSDEFIFRNLNKCKGGFVIRKENKPLTYSRMRELFIEAFKPFVSDIKSYGLHSLRSGGATISANNGVGDRLFKRHGRWRSETAKDGYVKDSMEDILRVSLNLGL